MEQALVERADVRYRAIDSGQLNGVNPLIFVRNGLRVLRGVGQALAIVDEEQPNVCLATGGYVCAPTVVACWLRGVPVVIYLPDVAPGWTIRGLSHFARRVAVSLPAAAEHFGGEAPAGKAVVTGYPVRPALVAAAQDRRAARQKLAQALDRPLDDDRPLVLVTGGSQGARSINRAVWQTLPQILPHAHLLHAVGDRDWLALGHELDRAVAALPEGVAERYHPFAYLHEEMALALAAADLCVARAGASTLGEFPVAGLPSILAPLPFGGVKQMENARELAAVGGATIVPDSQLNEELAPALLRLLADGGELGEMSDALALLAKPDAAQRIVDVLRAVAKS